MQYPVQLTLRGIARCDSLERYIGDEVSRLDRLCDGLLGCHVVAETLARRHPQPVQYSVRLNIALPGTEVVVSREHGEDIYAALREAFAAAGAQLNGHLRRHGAGARTGAGERRR